MYCKGNCLLASIYFKKWLYDSVHSFCCPKADHEKTISSNTHEQEPHQRALVVLMTSKVPELEQKEHDLQKRRRLLCKRVCRKFKHVKQTLFRFILLGIVLMFVAFVLTSFLRVSFHTLQFIHYNGLVKHWVLSGKRPLQTNLNFLLWKQNKMPGGEA